MGAVINKKFKGEKVMITMETIKRDLEDIRYYHSRQEMFDKAFDSVGKNSILETLARYNKVICFAPPKIYEMYVYIYIKCCTQEVAAEELCYSVNYVYKLNKKILEFFYDNMNKEAA